MSDNTQGAKLRAEAAKAVDSVVRGGRSLDAALSDAERRVGSAERGLLRLLCYGTLRCYWELCAQLDGFLSRPLKARDQIIHSLLVLGIYQLRETRVSEHAAVTMTVEAARLLQRPKLTGLVNAVLRNFLRRPPEIARDAEDTVRFNHPQWFIDLLREDWPDHWQQILDANDERAPMWLRVNPKRCSRAEYRTRLAESAGAGVDETSSILPGAEQAVRLSEPWAIDDLPGFAAGDVSVQDAAAQLAAPWLLAGGGTRILDACAAPGGKSGHLLELLGPKATLTAIDSDPERVFRISETLARLGLRATVLTADASKPNEWWDSEPFDRILLDAPCSASGVIRRHPDIKHLRRLSDIARLADAQNALLEASWGLLAPAGKLLYVTCSVLSQENNGVVARFMERHADAQVNNVLQNNNIHDLMSPRPHGYQILPGTRGLDGFYFACLQKRA